MTGKKLAVAGTINMDLSAQVAGFPQVGETVPSLSYLKNPGGKAANQAVAAGRMGADVAFIGKIGKDDFGQTLKAVLNQESIDTSHLYVDAEKSTGNAFIVINDSGANFIITNLEANAEVTAEEVKQALLAERAPDAVLLQLEVSPDITTDIVTFLHQQHIPIYLNLAPVTKIPKETRDMVDVLIVNEIEASELAGIKVIDRQTAEQSIHIINNNDKQTIIVTLGEKGVVFRWNGSFHYRKAQKVKAVDTTGAGDCFCGVLAAELLENDDMVHAVKTASKAASLAVGRYGAQSSMPYKQEMIQEQQ